MQQFSCRSLKLLNQQNLAFKLLQDQHKGMAKFGRAWHKKNQYQKVTYLLVTGSSLQVKISVNIRFFSLQALIFCQRYEDAERQCLTLLPGIDRVYLQAEVAWRSGSLNECLAFLKESRPLGLSQKCDALHEIVSKLLGIELSYTQAAEKGRASSVLSKRYIRYFAAAILAENKLDRSDSRPLTFSQVCVLVTTIDSLRLQQVAPIYLSLAGHRGLSLG